MAAPPVGHRRVAPAQQRLDLRPEQAQQGGDPDVRRPERARVVDAEAAEYGTRVRASVVISSSKTMGERCV